MGNCTGGSNPPLSAKPELILRQRDFLFYRRVNSGFARFSLLYMNSPPSPLCSAKRGAYKTKNYRGLIKQVKKEFVVDLLAIYIIRYNTKRGLCSKLLLLLLIKCLSSEFFFN
jgi:hypothetical protein